MPLPCAVIPMLVSAGLAGIAAPTAAHQDSVSDRDQSLRAQVEQADVIFEGVVTHVEYRLSNPSPASAPQLPYTFVTYRVDALLKGESPVKAVTLRFLGGLRDNGKILQVEGTPFFDVGDRDMLFVRNNGQSICPLLGCESGRLRLINNQVFNDLGQPQSLASTGHWVSGKRVPLREVLINQVGKHTVEYEIAAGREEPPDASATRAPDSAAVAVLTPTQLTGQQWRKV